MWFKFVVKMECPDEKVAEEIRQEVERKLFATDRYNAVFDVGPLKQGS